MALLLLPGLAIALAMAGPGMQEPPVVDLQGPDDELARLLQTQVISASRHAQDPLVSPQAVEVISGDLIRATGAFRLMDVLRLATSLQVLDGDGRTSRIALRGVAPNSSPKTVQVLVDGVPLYNPETFPVDLELLPVPVDTIDRVEIVRGPSSSLYGANAQLGVISILTRGPRARDGVTLRTGWGATGIQHLQASAKASSEDQGHSLSVGYGHSDWPERGAPYRLFGTSLEIPAYNAHQVRTWSLQVQVQVRETSRLWASLGHSDRMEEKDISRVPTGGVLFGFSGVRGKVDTAQMAWEEGWTPLLQTELRVQEVKQSLILGPLVNLPDSVLPGYLPLLFQMDPSLATGAHLQDVTTRQASFQATWRPQVDLHLVGGFDTRSNRTPGSPIQGIPNVRTTGTGAFLSADWTLAPLAFSAGLRAENEALGGSRVNPRFSVVWSLTPSTVLRGGVFTSTRSPQMVEALGAFDTPVNTAIQVIAQDLRPEKATSTEIGFRMNRSAFSLDATAFRIRLSGLISAVQIAQSPRQTTQYQNGSEILTCSGLELSVTARPVPGLLVGFNSTWQSYRDPSTGEMADWAPRTMATLWCKLTRERTFAFLAIQHMGAMTVSNFVGSSAREPRGSTFQCHFNLGYQPTLDTTFSLYGIMAARPATWGAIASYSEHRQMRYGARDVGIQTRLRF